MMGDQMNELNYDNMKEELLRVTSKLNQVEEVLSKREKVAALGDLIPGITHEINTPLGVAIALSGLRSGSGSPASRVATARCTALRTHPPLL